MSKPIAVTGGATGGAAGHSGVGGASAATGNDTAGGLAVEPELADVVARLRRAMRKAWRGADPGSPLSVAQLELLTCVSESPGARPGQVAKALRLAPNSVTMLVNGLSTRGFVERTPDEADRRSFRLALTPAGVAAVRRWQATNAGILAAALADLHPGWRQTMVAALPALRELVDAIDRVTDGA